MFKKITALLARIADAQENRNRLLRRNRLAADRRLDRYLAAQKNNLRAVNKETTAAGATAIATLAALREVLNTLPVEPSTKEK